MTIRFACRWKDRGPSSGHQETKRYGYNGQSFLSMKITIRDAGEAKIVEVEGNVDLSSSADLRRSLFSILVDSPKVALNLAGIRYIDSSGIAILIEALKDSQRLKKEFVLFGLSPAVEQVFRLTHVMRIFKVFNTEQEALGIG